eukprot:TRINITY_DN13999_c0_g1_i1.p1 TRINITY_DN13999_c0_g1~~TRINITY_DN13999_c0_g1_i1.p1  ORF type:complete len:515 (+),score=118.48 TRINITY_DN13999_c0_g1_i1:386-1930(+)
MADMLRDEKELHRRQCAMVLASLLSENYIKFRGPLMFRFMFALSDPTEGVRHLVECVFARIVLTRHPGLFAQIFVETLCALNGWLGHPSYQGAKGNEAFSLASSPERRTVVYRFMLRLMNREQKFNVCSQLVTGFLAAFTGDAGEDSPCSLAPSQAGSSFMGSTALRLPKREFEPGGQALGDALAILGCKEMRICFSPKLAGADVEDEEDPTSATAAGAGEAARGVLSGVLKRVICENIAPILVQLKFVMEEQRSPFLGRLRHCLCEILREFKEDELREILDDDEQLIDEICFDLAKGAGATAAAAAAAATSSADTGVAATADSEISASAEAGPSFSSGVRSHHSSASAPFRHRRVSIGTAMRSAATADTEDETMEAEPAEPEDELMQTDLAAEQLSVRGRKRQHQHSGGQGSSGAPKKSKQAGPAKEAVLGHSRGRKDRLIATPQQQQQQHLSASPDVAEVAMQSTQSTSPSRSGHHPASGRRKSSAPALGVGLVCAAMGISSAPEAGLASTP